MAANHLPRRFDGAGEADGQSTGAPVSYERRDLLARTARDHLAEVLGLEPASLARLDAATAGAITRAVLYPTGGAGVAPKSGVLQRIGVGMFGPRFFRWRRSLRASSLLGQPWRLLAILELGLMMALVGVGAGLLLRGAGSPVAHAPTTRRAAATPVAGIANAPPKPAPSVAAPGPGSAVSDVAVATLGAKLGLPYLPGGCVGTAACLRNPVATTGDGAAYVEVTAEHAPGGLSHCVVYLHDAGGQWSADAATCVDSATPAPVTGATVPVAAPGSCARIRRAAGLTSPVIACLRDGTLVTVDAAPVYRDGHLWFSVSAPGVSGVVALEALRFRAL